MRHERQPLRCASGIFGGKFLRVPAHVDPTARCPLAPLVERQSLVSLR